LAGFKRNTVEQQLVIRNTENKSRVASLGQRLLQLFPGSFKLAFRTLVVRPVEPRVLNKNIETVKESSRGRAAACVDLGGVRDSSLLEGTKLRDLA
jgi:hypothetical protein